MASRPAPYPQFLLIGDSIIQFSSNLSNGGYQFGAGLAEHCSRRLDVVNRGLSGYTTSNILKVLPDLIPDPSVAKVDYILFLCGANDACLPESPSKQHIPLPEYITNLRTILTHPLLKAHSPTILLVTPPPLNEAHLEAEDLKKGYPLTRTQTTTATYAAAARSVAAELASQNVVLVDLWAALMDEAARLYPDLPGLQSPFLIGTRERGDHEGLRKLIVDGLHLTGDGYKVFLEAVLPHVGKEWLQEDPNAPSWILPHWTIAPKKDA